MQSTNSDPLASAAFAVAIVAGTCLLLLAIATWLWNVFMHLWQVFALSLAVGILFFCFYRAFESQLCAAMRTDIDLDTLDKYDDNDELIPKDTEPKVQSAPAKRDKPPESSLPAHSKVERDVLDCPLHLACNLTQNQVTRVEQTGYLLKEFVPLGKTRREWYYVQEQKPESFEHTFVVYSLVAKLKPYVQDMEVHRTQQPDIVFYYKGERHALEVETPHCLPRKRARLSRKAKRLTREYGVRWWFVTTRSAYAKTFRAYGDVLTRNQIGQWITDTFTPPFSTPPPLNTK